MEAFPDAEMDVILDVRRQLTAPLLRFRSALAAASEHFSSAPWETSFPNDVDDFYRRVVAPALLEVQEALEELGARQTLLRLTSRRDVVAATLALATASRIAEIPAVIYGSSGAALVASEAAIEMRERRRARAEAERNSFYFFYRANAAMRDGSFN
jgi:hypothetical protein